MVILFMIPSIIITTEPKREHDDSNKREVSIGSGTHTDTVVTCDSSLILTVQEGH
jgi:hypothetical protein